MQLAEEVDEVSCVGARLGGEHQLRGRPVRAVTRAADMLIRFQLNLCAARNISWAPGWPHAESAGADSSWAIHAGGVAPLTRPVLLDPAGDASSSR